MNENWQRWIVSSIHKHFEAACSAATPALKYFIEAVPKSHEKDALTCWCEGRVDGPYWQFGTANESHCKIEVNMLISWKIDGKDFYKAERLKGLLTKAFTTSIPVFKLGTGIDDDPTSVVTCLQLVTTGREAVVVSDFGQVGAGVQIKQATVEGHFSGDFYE